MASFQTAGVALVTGSAGGIGLAAANALAEAGASAIVFADVDEARVQSAAEQSRKLAIHDNYQARGWHVDVTEQESVEDLVKKTAKEFGRIDYLVNSAGVPQDSNTPIPDTDIAEYDRIQAINTRGMLLVSRAAAEIMVVQEPRSFCHSRTGSERELGRGCIVNITSVMSYVGIPGKVAYMASKHAAIGVTKASALDLASKGIRVNAVCPSWVKTPMYERDCAKNPYIPAFIEGAVTLLKRPAEAEEVGESVVYLCSPAASYVNGIGLIIDAGLTLTVHLS